MSRNQRVARHKRRDYDRKRKVLHAVQGGLCVLCGEPLGKLTRAGSLDHLYPKAYGGKAAWGKVALAHARCNGARGSKALTPEQLERAAPVLCLTVEIVQARFPEHYPSSANFTLPACTASIIAR